MHVVIGVCREDEEVGMDLLEEVGVNLHVSPDYVHTPLWSRDVHTPLWSRDVHTPLWSRDVHTPLWSCDVHTPLWLRDVHTLLWSRDVHTPLWSCDYPSFTYTSFPSLLQEETAQFLPRPLLDSGVSRSWKDTVFLNLPILRRKVEALSKQLGVALFNRV